MSETRTAAFGERYELTWVDRLGVWLSARQVRRWTGDLRGKRVADIGCGFEARLGRALMGRAARVLLIDVALAGDLKRDGNADWREGCLPEVLDTVEPGSLDVLLCISVLEHLDDPLETLIRLRRILAPGGICLINVPSWTGKRWLEFSAFRLGTSPPAEMDDHKCYYDPRDLWPLLVKAGFAPSAIRCFRHKFGLNTFAVCYARERHRCQGGGG